MPGGPGGGGGGERAERCVEEEVGVGAAETVMARAATRPTRRVWVCMVVVCVCGGGGWSKR